METYSDAVGQWTTMSVRARDRDEATGRARREARNQGYRVADVGSAVRQPDGHVWRVELRVRGECE